MADVTIEVDLNVKWHMYANSLLNTNNGFKLPCYVYSTNCSYKDYGSIQLLNMGHGI